MQYRQMVKKVQVDSGFSDAESEEALRLFVETLAARLNEGERRDFAAQLPRELQPLAMAPTTERYSANDMYEQFTQLQEIDLAHAKKQIKAAWAAVKESIGPGEVADIRSQLPKDLKAELPD